MKTTFRLGVFAIAILIACAMSRAAGVPSVEITVKQSAGGKTGAGARTALR